MLSGDFQTVVNEIEAELKKHDPRVVLGVYDKLPDLAALAMYAHYAAHYGVTIGTLSTQEIVYCLFAVAAEAGRDLAEIDNRTQTAFQVHYGH